VRYIAGSHRGPVLEHHSPNDDPRVMALECIGAFDPALAVECPLPPGGAVIHHCRTLHGSGANQTDLPRCAYILAFRGPVRANPEFRGFPWNVEKHTAAQDRRESWDNRGGAVGRAARDARQAIRRTMNKVRGRVGRWLR
jgi:hypothetical protein